MPTFVSSIYSYHINFYYAVIGVLAILLKDSLVTMISRDVLPSPAAAAFVNKISRYSVL